MTDLEMFIKTYEQFGIEIKTFSDSGCDEILVDLNDSWDGIATKSPKLDGHCGFFSRVIFSKEGKFLKQGFWE